VTFSEGARITQTAQRRRVVFVTVQKDEPSAATERRERLLGARRFVP